MFFKQCRTQIHVKTTTVLISGHIQCGNRCPSCHRGRQVLAPCRSSSWNTLIQSGVSRVLSFNGLSMIALGKLHALLKLSYLSEYEEGGIHQT